ncbi:hypothetical protein SKAU_G00169930 [Synaphobranchus kaupii]|uniref:Uncharacterized protein n=1 Tax=Synaphobranchus kaupii TaxID=118154 RepID=A0A9Q1J093_SYNKA|nr:hypothetical protein SKAU_G00169930 [Synaphobranchus kaupii]
MTSCITSFPHVESIFQADKAPCICAFYVHSASGFYTLLYSCNINLLEDTLPVQENNNITMLKMILGTKVSRDAKCSEKGSFTVM